MYTLLQLLSALPAALIVWLFLAVIVQEVGARLLKKPLARAQSGLLSAVLLIGAFLLCLAAGR